MPELKSPSKCQAPDGSLMGSAQRTMSPLSGNDPLGLRDPGRLIVVLIHPFAWKQALLVEDIQQDEGRHDQERGESGRDEHRRDRSGRRCRLRDRQ